MIDILKTRRFFVSALTLSFLLAGCDAEELVSPKIDVEPEAQFTLFDNGGNVVIIGGPVLNTGTYCSGYLYAANYMGRTYGGCLPLSGQTDLDKFTFAPMTLPNVNATNLAPYDIAVLNMATVESYCNTDNLSAQAKTDLVAFVGSGKKLIIYDSECSPRFLSGVKLDYSWLPFPFTTANPGALGQHGTLQIWENNTLSSDDNTSPYYIDAAYLGTYTDAVGDMNVMVTLDPHWCLDMTGTNAIPASGPVHTYAKYPVGTDVGLLIYNGLDMDASSRAQLRQVWINELLQPVAPSDLPCGFIATNITLTQDEDENNVGEDHTVTATLLDYQQNPKSGFVVTFEVLSGPNAGVTGTGTSDANGQVSFTYTGSGGTGVDEIQAKFTDGDGQLKTSNILSKTWVNTPPSLGVDSDPIAVDEGQTAYNTGTVTDADGDDVTLATSLGTVVNNEDGTWSWSFSTSDGPAESQTVSTTADDGNGGTASTSFALTVNNVPPTVGDVAVPAAPVAISAQPVSVSAPFSDPAGTADQPYSCAIDYDDGTGTHLGTVSGTTCQGSYTYAEPGLYNVTVYVTDKDGGTGSNASALPIVIYDPEGGFVTGGGWIDSPAGAYKPDMSLSGKATFGFVAKYKKGQATPDGNTEFQFHAAGMNFHSDSYDWLVVTGSDYAMFKGMGTINGGFCPDGDLYRFRLWAGDDDPDTFRIRIWCEDAFGVETDTYDNGFDQAIDAGSIVIHTKK